MRFAYVLNTLLFTGGARVLTSAIAFGRVLGGWADGNGHRMTNPTAPRPPPPLRLGCGVNQWPDSPSVHRSTPSRRLHLLTPLSLLCQIGYPSYRLIALSALLLNHERCDDGNALLPRSWRTPSLPHGCPFLRCTIISCLLLQPYDTHPLALSEFQPCGTHLRTRAHSPHTSSSTPPTHVPPSDG